jgi:hypothetical protein
MHLLKGRWRNNHQSHHHLMIIASSQKVADEFIEDLQRHYKEVNVSRGNNHSYLGMNFNFQHGKVAINMKNYIDNILSSHNVSGHASTPASSDFFPPKASELLSPVEQKRMHTSVAQLLYLGTRVRPDILLVVNYLTTRVNKFTKDDEEKLIRCLKYLNQSKDIGLNLSVSLSDSKLQVTTYADASSGIHPADGKSPAIVTTLGTGMVHASTHKQRVTTKSSSEAELVCASDATSETIGLRNYLLSRGHQVNPSILGQDNLSTKSILEKGPRVARRIKHLNIRYFFVQDYINKKQMIVKYVNTNPDQTNSIVSEISC